MARNPQRDTALVGMIPDLAYAVALAEARSCLAALADSAPEVEEASFFESLLIELDVITGDVGPATYPITTSRPELVTRLVRALNVLGTCRG